MLAVLEEAAANPSWDSKANPLWLCKQGLPKVNPLLTTSWLHAIQKASLLSLNFCILVSPTPDVVSVQLAIPQRSCWPIRKSRVAWRYTAGPKSCQWNCYTNPADMLCHCSLSWRPMNPQVPRKTNRFQNRYRILPYASDFSSLLCQKYRSWMCIEYATCYFHIICKSAYHWHSTNKGSD